MTVAGDERLMIRVDAQQSVSGLLERPRRARAVFVVAHGAGAGMLHPSVQAIAGGLGERGIATLRYQFPYIERGGRRPDPPALCHAAVRAAVAEAARLAPDLPLVSGGRSFGGRMTSQAQALTPLPQVRGLAFLAFPLHPAGKPATDRAAHLRQIGIPMLFVQGTRDPLARLDLLERLVRGLGPHGTLRLLRDADHSFHVPARSGGSDSLVLGNALDALCEWLERLGGSGHARTR
jgi:predicted alpha/beta-hydrolase family hydrolase